MRRNPPGRPAANNGGAMGAIFPGTTRLKRRPAKEPALARKIQQSDQQKANAQEFRRRMLDTALRRLLRLADESSTSQIVNADLSMTKAENKEIPAQAPEIAADAVGAVGVE
jgi:C4-type Zn-finger protein